MYRDEGYANLVEGFTSCASHRMENNVLGVCVVLIMFYVRI